MEYEFDKNGLKRAKYEREGVNLEPNDPYVLCVVQPRIDCYSLTHTSITWMDQVGTTGLMRATGCTSLRQDARQVSSICCRGTQSGIARRTSFPLLSGRPSRAPHPWLWRVSIPLEVPVFRALRSWLQRLCLGSDRLWSE